jgi:hypothetical protein
VCALTCTGSTCSLCWTAGICRWAPRTNDTSGACVYLSSFVGVSIRFPVGSSGDRALEAVRVRTVVDWRDVHCMQVVHGAQTTKVNIDGGRATGVTFVVKGPDGRRHTGGFLEEHILAGRFCACEEPHIADARSGVLTAL